MDDLRLILIVCGVALLGAVYLWGIRRRRRAREPLDDSPSHRAAAGHFGDDTDSEGLIRVRSTRPGATGAPGTAPGRGAVTIDPTQLTDLATDLAPDLATDPSMDRAPADPRSDYRSLTGLKAQRRAPEQLDLAGLDLSAAPSEPTPTIARARKRSRGEPPTPACAKSKPAEDFVLALTIMAPEGRRFRGGELHRALEHEGLRHGDYQAFHRHTAGPAPKSNSPNPPNPVFSVVNVVQPGGFDLEAIDELNTPGIALFTQVPGPSDPSTAFDDMLATAERLAQCLGGRLCDDSRSTLTAQSVNLMRERISEHGRRQLLRT